MSNRYIGYFRGTIDVNADSIEEAWEKIEKLIESFNIDELDVWEDDY